MGFYPTNPLLGQTVQSEAADLSPDKGFIAHLVFTATQAIAASTTGILAAFATSTLATEKTSGFTQPTCAKNVTATAGGTAGDIKAVQVVVEGLDIAGNVISETLPAFTVDTAGSVAGSKAFKTITKVTVPGMDGAGATVAIGFGEILGIPYKLPTNTCLLGSKGATKEGTAPTVAVNSSVLASNTIDFNSALDGTEMHAYFIV